MLLLPFVVSWWYTVGTASLRHHAFKRGGGVDDVAPRDNMRGSLAWKFRVCGDRSPAIHSEIVGNQVRAERGDPATRRTHYEDTAGSVTLKGRQIRQQRDGK